MNINTINKHLFNRLILVTHWLTESELRNLVGKPVSRALAVATLKMKGGKSRDVIDEIAQEWQKMFPSKKMVPITKIENNIAYAEIRTHCPYRGSRNVNGCYRMMEYDRRLMETIGAELVVIRSQAEPGVEHCLIAFGKNCSDLTPAHVRVGAKDKK